MAYVQNDPYPYRQWCPICGWSKGGNDSWDGDSCKCGFVFDPSLPDPESEDIDV